MTDRDDEESLMAFLEVTAAPDPGDLGEDEPTIRPLCRECLDDLPDGADGLCAFCRVVKPGGGA
ncbi:hypothetical protein DE4576_00357 [Mycobacterium marinum]|uniref:Uncharacterized protein n=1 Tax=Mycobacterium marinum TaxID=1781 RepID=A0A3E2MQE4_MYCMR|nr:hypothetical protein [Mycobacterium marinum]RFZ34982.1 hypothetical protein DAVIS_04532 [Mycobacterium marinum]RFZ70464.1 hypothetical protein DE4576_00357 [Mycobacterium marinum]GJO43086.1 hypothetical protein NJB1604_18120 [Mycobacterium marinum]